MIVGTGVLLQELLPYMALVTESLTGGYAELLLCLG
jgi:hypothetical protein